MKDSEISRRQLLRGAAVGTAVGAGALTYASLPAWARTASSSGERGLAFAPAAARKALSLPYPHLKAGKFVESFTPEIEHVVVLMMENHSFDNLLGMVPHRVKGRGKVDGLTMKNGKITNSNPTTIAPVGGPEVKSFHAASPCQGDSIGQDWNTSHACWNNGANNGFVDRCGTQAMWYWDNKDLPFTYSLTEHFPIGERYFCSVMAQTYPNRRFLFCGTASGLTATSGESFGIAAKNGTIFNLLLKYGISWKDYVEGGTTNASPLIVKNFNSSNECLERVSTIDEFYSDAKKGKLPSFSFLDPNYTTTSQENPQDIDLGEQFIAKVVNAVMHSPQWEKTALFITYDEHGGYYDHVPPPVAIAPDDIKPQQSLANPANSLEGKLNYGRYGFRVPLMVVSPWAKQNYASRITQDHTSITAFIEHKWNLPAMSARDANAHPMNDYFDFKKAAFKKPPKLAGAPSIAAGLKECTAAGYPNPPGE
jgi:phospholipase C